MKKFLDVNYSHPYFFFKHIDETNRSVYEKGFILNDLFPIKNAFLITCNNKCTFFCNKESLQETIKDFAYLEPEISIIKYNLKNNGHWKIQNAKKDLLNSQVSNSNICKIAYKPFDFRWTYYTGVRNGFHVCPYEKSQKNILIKNNIALILSKSKSFKNPVFLFSVQNTIISRNFVYCYESLFFLYTYVLGKKTLNFSKQIISEISKGLKLSFDINNSNNLRNAFNPINVIDYIYAVLYSAGYKQKYYDLLSTVPRIPYPIDNDIFWKLVDLGNELRKLHLLENLDESINEIHFLKKGNNVITHFLFESKNETIGKVWINKTQFFDNVPLMAWNCNISHERPAYRWLKSRKNLVLNNEEITHYKKMIIALSKINDILEKINKIKFFD